MLAPLHRAIRASFVLLLSAVFASCGSASDAVTAPDEFFGFEMGADYQLANYTQFVDYMETLAGESRRMALDTIGLTEEGRPQLMSIITAPANHKELDRYRDIARRLALAEDVDEAQARALAEDGKAIIWIDGGLHATEVLGAQQLTELVYRLVSMNDPETTRILDDVIILAVHANPDGMELVSDWYMRNDDPLIRSTGGLPVLYEKYAGHDNNRDFYMANLAETTNMNRVMYREWYPQIVYNHHQTGPQGTVMFAPPFRDPPNHYLDPLVLTGLQRVGSAMHDRFVVEGKGGTTMRSGANYSTWWNGGLRTTPYFHNMLGLLTETIGNPTPITIPFIPTRQISGSDLPLPVEAGEWHFRQSVEYSMTANWAVLDFASRNRDLLLFNIWRMGMNSVERGQRDSWRNLPAEVEAASAASGGGRGGRGGAVTTGADPEEMLTRSEDREPRGYILSADQPDFGTATKFVNALLKNGVTVNAAAGDFAVGGLEYPAGSYVVRTDQAFAPHVFDMFEPQDHPNDFAFPGAPPTPPYDVAGWTLAYQMGVSFDRILEDFDGPFEPIADLAVPPGGGIVGADAAVGYLIDHRDNDGVVAVNRLLAAGREVFWMQGASDVGDQVLPPGAFWVPEAEGVRAELAGHAREFGFVAHATAVAVSGEALRLNPVRVGLWDQYGGSMPSGWTRMVLEDFEVDFEVVFPPQLDAGGLTSDFDVLVFPTGAIPGVGGGGRGGRGGGRGGGGQANIPTEYQGRQGSVSAETTVPQLLTFMREGGTVVTIGSSTNLAYHAGLPITNHMVSAAGEGLNSAEYYIPGSILEVGIHEGSPVVHGLEDRLDVVFNSSPVFRVGAQAPGSGLRVLGSFDTPAPLQSGWAWGQERLEGGAALIEATVGEGTLFLFGPEVAFRAQPHGSFPLVLNAILLGLAEPVILP